MELLSILQRLAQHRVLVVAGIVPALLAGLIIGFQVSLSPFAIASRDETRTIGRAQILIQTQREPIADLQPEGAELPTLGARALMMSDLMATDTVRRDIARRAGIALDRLTVVAPSQNLAEVPTRLAVEANALRLTTPYVLIAAADGVIPIVSLAATAPPKVDPRPLAAAGVASFQQLVSAQDVRSGLRAAALGPARAQIIHEGSKVPLGVAATFMIFLLWCSAIVVLTSWLARLSRPRHAASASTAR